MFPTNTPHKGRDVERRLIELDAFRGFALLLMILMHNMWTWGPPSIRGGLWSLGDLYFGASASIFFAASGAAAHIHVKKSLRYGTLKETVLFAISRAALLYSIGIAFEQIWRPPPYSLTFFAELNTIAAISVIVLVLNLFTKTTQVLILILSVFSYFLLRYVIVLTSLGGGEYAFVPWLTDKPIIQFNTGHLLFQVALEFCYSTLMWGSYGVLGALLIAFHLTSHQIARRVGAGGLALMLLGYILHVHFLSPFQKWPMSISYFFFATGFTMFVFWSSTLIASSRFTRFSVILSALGRNTLSFYFSHYFILWFTELIGFVNLVWSIPTSIVGYWVSAILAVTVLTFTVLAYVFRNFNLIKSSRLKRLPNWTCFLIAISVSIMIVLYVDYGQTITNALGVSNEYQYFLIDVVITTIWYMIFRILRV